MKIKNLDFEGVFTLVPPRFGDARGWFSEIWNNERLVAAGLTARFIQDNMSFSRPRGTVRGLHFQSSPHAQAKLVMVARGAIQDVIVDIRPQSKTFGQYTSVTLTAEGGEQIYIPAGFAHGFCTLCDDTCVIYKIDAPYAPASEGGIAWDDPDLNIPWQLGGAPAVLSDKDKKLPRFRDIAKHLRETAP